MQYGVVLYPDQKTTEWVRELWGAFAELGIENILHQLDVRPHITLTMHSAMRADEALASVEKYFSNVKRLQTVFSAVGFFPGEISTLFLLPTVTNELMQLQSRLHTEVDGFENAAPHYLPANWMPHCTLAMAITSAEIGRVLRGVPALGKNWAPLVATLDSVAILSAPDELSSESVVEEIYVRPLT